MDSDAETFFSDDNVAIGEPEDELPESESDGDELPLKRQKKNFKVLKEEDIKNLQEKDIALLSSTLSVSRVAACMLLHRYTWNVDNVQEAWFADQRAVREDVGFMDKPLVMVYNNKNVVCGICFDNFVRDIRLEKTIGFCGHPFCNDCLVAYICRAIKDGPGCLFLKCPEPSCSAAVGGDVVDLLVSDEVVKNKYKGYIIRSYVENNRKTKWCPAPGCGNAVEYELGSESFDVCCFCLCSFCWNCLEEAHRPVECETVANWNETNMNESHNATWILANSKPCPNCKVSIEKSMGCNHMTCNQCRFEFCWLCLCKFRGHGTCNSYNKSTEQKEEDEFRRIAKKNIARYTHYYERWGVNNNSMKKAMADLHEMETANLEKLVAKLDQPRDELKYITEAWEQIVECRRTLKWTYVYGYYIPEHQSARIYMFEFLQGQAEKTLEKLHHCAEELDKYLKDGKDDFYANFKTNLTNLTIVTGKYFGELVTALENGLSDVNSVEACCPTRVITQGSWQCDVCGYRNEAVAIVCWRCYTWG